MERGKHVYVQKPLTRTVWEARQMMEAANKYKVATQMGNQGYSNEGTRQAAEIVWSGQIGNVTEVHAWTDRPIWPQGSHRDSRARRRAEHARLGSVAGHCGEAARSRRRGQGYPNEYGGVLRALQLARILRFRLRRARRYGVPHPGRSQYGAEAGFADQRRVHQKRRHQRFHVPQEVDHPVRLPGARQYAAVKLFWYDGLDKTPELPGVPQGEYLGDLPTPNRGRGRGRGAAAAAGSTPAAPPPKPPETGFIGGVFDYEAFQKVLEDPNPRIPKPDGSVFIGDKGIITTGTYGSETRLIPVEKMKDYKFPEKFLTRSPGHYADWIRACKGGDPACSNFNVAAPFVEWMLLGVIALRVEGKIEYDPAKMRITNNADANKYMRPTFRKGWSLT